MINENFELRVKWLAKYSKKKSWSRDLLSDEYLITAVQEGDKESLTVLVQRYHAQIFAFLFRTVNGNRQLAEDLTQETFFRMVRGVQTYNAAQRFKPWLYSIAANLAKDHFKKADTRNTEPEIIENEVFDHNHLKNVIEDQIIQDESSSAIKETLLVVVSTLHTQQGVEYRILGDPPSQFNPLSTNPSLEDGYLWLMRSAQ